MDAWRRYLGEAAGVPELRASGLRSVHPGIWGPVIEVPLPTLPTDGPSQSIRDLPTGRKKLQAMVEATKTTERKIAALRDKTSDLFGNSFIVNNSLYGDLVARYSDSGEVEVISTGTRAGAG